MSHVASSSQGPISSLVFLAEDDPALRALLASALRREGYHVLEAADGRALTLAIASALLARGAPGRTLVVSDVRMPGQDGLGVLRAFGNNARCPPFILLTAFGDPELHAEARRLGALAVFDKPFDVDLLCAAVRAHFRGGAQPA
jgi:DNA-binding response OmpR family regulator